MSAVATGGGRPLKYRLANGDVVPGVTTILGKYKDPGGLVHWAWSLGLEGKDYRRERDDAGDTGHIAHDLIDCDIHGREMPETNDARAVAALDAFREWRTMVKLEIVDTERPLVSEMHRYGGTYDALATVNGKLVLLDWKTSNKLYPEMVAQLAAYRQLIREACKKGQRQMCPETAVLLRVGKEFGDFHHHQFTSECLDAGWERFRASQWLCETDSVLKRMV